LPQLQFKEGGEEVNRASLLHAIGRPIAFHPGLVPVLGSVNAVLFFGQIFYWQDKTDCPIGVYKSSEEIQQETGLTYREQSNAREKLRDCGVLIETEKRLEHRIYFRIDFDALDALLANCEKRIPRNDKSAVRETTKAQSDETTKAQSVIQRLPVSTAVNTAVGDARPATAEGQAYLDRVTSHERANQSITMTTDWQPSDQFPALMMRAGMKADVLTDEILAKFVIHHNGTSKPQGIWESALVTWCKREQPNSPKNGLPGCHVENAPMLREYQPPVLPERTEETAANARKYMGQVKELLG
jgi:hypothetical protein